MAPGFFAEKLPHICLFDQAADVVRQHLDGGGVLAAVGHDDVRVALAGLHKSFMHGLDGGQVLLITLSRLRPRSLTSRTRRRRMRSSASVSTKIL